MLICLSICNTVNSYAYVDISTHYIIYTCSFHPLALSNIGRGAVSSHVFRRQELQLERQHRSSEVGYLQEQLGQARVDAWPAGWGTGVGIRSGKLLGQF